VDAPFREAAAGKVEGEDREVEGQQHTDRVKGVHAAAAIAVEEDDAGQRLEATQRTRQRTRAAVN